MSGSGLARVGKCQRKVDDMLCRSAGGAGGDHARGRHPRRRRLSHLGQQERSQHPPRHDQPHHPDRLRVLQRSHRWVGQRGHGHGHGGVCPWSLAASLPRSLARCIAWLAQYVLCSWHRRTTQRSEPSAEECRGAEGWARRVGGGASCLVIPSDPVRPRTAQPSEPQPLTERQPGLEGV